MGSSTASRPFTDADVEATLAAIRAKHGAPPADRTSEPIQIPRAPFDDVPLVEPAPCDGCRHRDRCSRGEACRAFAIYLMRPTQWRQAPRHPSVDVFLKLFGEGLREAA